MSQSTLNLKSEKVLRPCFLAVWEEAGFVAEKENKPNISSCKTFVFCQPWKLVRTLPPEQRSHTFIYIRTILNMNSIYTMGGGKVAADSFRAVRARGTS